jgi:oligopeptide/dipeptide ABC transporter ATP-binding protein
MRDLQEEIGTSIMFVTHNMGVVAQMCDEVAVMYLGRVVERATVDEIFYDPKHPYTVSLLRSIPRLGTKRGERLEVIKGSVPDPYSTVSGCPFHPRCPSFMPGLCDVLVPEETPIEGNLNRTVRCHLYPGSTVGAEPGTSGRVLGTGDPNVIPLTHAHGAASTVSIPGGSGSGTVRDAEDPTRALGASEESSGVIGGGVNDAVGLSSEEAPKADTPVGGRSKDPR